VATGTTANFNLDRDGLVTLAYRKLGIAATSTLLSQGADALNLIIREEDARGTGQAKNLWALSESAIILTANGFVYSTTEGLDNNIIELVAAYYRNTSGDDTQLSIIDHEGYENLSDKNTSGDVTDIYLKRDDVTRANQLLYVYPAPSSVGTTSEVTGSDSLNYTCIMGHTSVADNKPITGQNYKMYWVQKGSAGSAWATATAYTNGELIRYLYKRPLYDFDASTDNPDMPSSWSRYLMWRLANDLTIEVDADIETRQWIKREVMEARADLFNSGRVATNNLSNRVEFF